MDSTKFLDQLSETNRESESLNIQISQIQTIIAMLQNEITQASCEEQSIKEVYEAEKQLLQNKVGLAKDNDRRVVDDIRDLVQQVEGSMTANENMI